MVDRLATLPVFLVVGVGLQLLTAGALFVMFRRPGWLSSDRTVPPPPQPSDPGWPSTTAGKNSI